MTSKSDQRLLNAAIRLGSASLGKDRANAEYLEAEEAYRVAFREYETERKGD